MFNLPFNKKKKRQIILENFNNPTYEISLTKLQGLSNFLGATFYNSSSLNTNCGDTVSLLIQKKNGLVELVRFASEQQACCLTIAATNILCGWMENKDIELVKTEISQIERMLQGKTYQLNCPQMEVFQDLPNFPHRIECISVVLRGIKKLLQKQTQKR
jgi:NifU-like protein involved in Fe-S cluster formation